MHGILFQQVILNCQSRVATWSAAGQDVDGGGVEWDAGGVWSEQSLAFSQRRLDSLLMCCFLLSAPAKSPVRLEKMQGHVARDYPIRRTGTGAHHFSCFLMKHPSPC